VPTPADLFLSPDLTEAQAREYLESLGFRSPAAADQHLQRMADDPAVREALARLAPDLISSLLESLDPDAALEGVSHYVTARSGRAMFLDYLREDPRALHVLTYVMGASPMLSEILIRTPEYFHWLVAQVERSAPDRQDHEEELVSAFGTVDDPVEALNMLRRWKRRETLRVGARDLLRRETVQTVAAQLSDIASVAVDFALAIVMRQLLDAEGRDTPPGSFAVIATDQLGAQEMSYGSDINLLYVYDGQTPDAAAAVATQAFFVKAGCDLTAALRDETHEGYLYRVTLPTWPETGGWLKACSLDEYAAHYAASVDTRERWSLLRARPIAGDAELGDRFLACTQQFVYGNPAEATAVIAASAATTDRASEEIQRFTQASQLRHGAHHAQLRYTNTLAALEAMGRVGLLEEPLRRELDHAYVFLRSAEHRRELGLKEDVDTQLAASHERVREIVRKLVHGP
jgi:[glutamine synthetase] adenylyltransferase / [glutamine synthetase]-adenylyl-L-tyrosine phosphorylase